MQRSSSSYFFVCIFIFFAFIYFSLYLYLFVFFVVLYIYLYFLHLFIFTYMYVYLFTLILTFIFQFPRIYISAKGQENSILNSIPNVWIENPKELLKYIYFYYMKFKYKCIHQTSIKFQIWCQSFHLKNQKAKKVDFFLNFWINK